jgi:hypothetical protein
VIKFVFHKEEIKINKQYREIDFLAGSNVESAVNTLLYWREQGVQACGKFNGIILYSDTVTMDDAYKQITGKTKAEFDESQRKWKEDYDKEKRDFKENIPALSEEWKRKGREILTDDKWEFWDTIVPIRLNDLYRGMELGCCLEIVNILNNNGTLEEAKKEIENQSHSGMSFGLVRSMVREFCDRGNEFVEYVK